MISYRDQLSLLRGCSTGPCWSPLQSRFFFFFLWCSCIILQHKMHLQSLPILLHYLHLSFLAFWWSLLTFLLTAIWGFFDLFTSDLPRDNPGEWDGRWEWWTGRTNEEQMKNKSFLSPSSLALFSGHNKTTRSRWSCMCDRKWTRDIKRDE